VNQRLIANLTGILLQRLFNARQLVGGGCVREKEWARRKSACSNPDCGALTAGPTVDEVGSVNLGEAAHIYELTAKSARYTASLTTSELSDITNGIGYAEIATSR
jgi:hypothetical protein